MSKKIYIVNGYERKYNEEIYWIEDIFENEEQAKACCKYFSIRNDNAEYSISEHEICTDDYVKDLESIKQGEWLLVYGENFMSIQPQYCCSLCENMISTYYPPNVCEHCGSINKNKGNSILVSIANIE